MNWGAEAQRRLKEIARCSSDDDGVTRFPFTAEHTAALQQMQAWMDSAGLSYHLDAAGTLIGRRQGPAGGPTLLIGSHQDSVRNGGGYDGIMGIAIGCLALEKLAEEGHNLPFAVEVLAFADEEGVRFPTALVGPRALAGTLGTDIAQLTDGDGISFGQALKDFGGNPDQLYQLKRDPSQIAGYLEVHIEQGPALESADAAVGVVTGICGIERSTVIFAGETGHAGTVPMENRQDALVSAAKFITRIHEGACQCEDLRATIGTLALSPNVANGIPKRVEMILEVRSPNDDERTRFAEWAHTLGDQIARCNGTRFSQTRTYLQSAVPCAAGLTETLEQAAQQLGYAALRLPSGATHDASAMADLCDIAMLFVRCRGGVSHKGEEYATDADMDAAVQVTAEFLKRVTA